MFVIYGNGDIRITELTSDLTAVKEGGVNQLLLEAQREGIGLRAEGCHAYRINGYYYYFFIEWPANGNQRRRQICYRSRQMLGPFECQIVLDDNMGYLNHGVAQGGIFEAGNGQWYSVLFQDYDAVGRIPIVLPVSWKDDWPVFGIEGKAPEEFATALPYTPTAPIICSDEFDYTANKLALQWQWNHNPDHALWTLTERPGYLRLKTGALTGSVLKARNTLTQRTQGPACKHETLLDLTNLQSGDHAGLVALQNWFGTVGAKVDDNGACSIVMTINNGAGQEQIVESVPYSAQQVYLKIEYNFENSVDQACFYFASEPGQWQAIGQTLHMKYSLDHFMGYRTGLFCYASQQSGGYADFAYFHHSSLLK